MNEEFYHVCGNQNTDLDQAIQKTASQVRGLIEQGYMPTGGISVIKESTMCNGSRYIVTQAIYKGNNNAKTNQNQQEYSCSDKKSWFKRIRNSYKTHK